MMTLSFLKARNTRALALFTLAGLVPYFFLPPECSESARRMAGIFVFAALCWAFEIIPLYVTALLTVFLETLLLCGPKSLPPVFFLKSFTNQVIVLFFGSFVLTRAFQKWGVDTRIAAMTLRYFQGSPFRLLLGIMAVTGYLSMWISNTAAAALMFALIQPLLRGLDEKDPFRKGLAMAVAFACVYGGIATPVGTPPNAIAVELLSKSGIHISFLKWTLFGFPFAFFLIFLSAAIIWILFPSSQKKIEFRLQPPENISSQEIQVLLVALGTVALWLSSGWHKIPEGFCALLAAGVLAAAGLVNARDIRNIDWGVLILMWGGLSLGAGMEATGLARWMMDLPFFEARGAMLFFIFAVLSVFLSTFMSNTATVNLLLPLALSLSGQEILPLALLVTVSSSFDFPLPMSTPPMAIAYGTGAVKVADMIKLGSILTLLNNVLLGLFVYLIFRP